MKKTAILFILSAFLLIVPACIGSQEPEEAQPEQSATTADELLDLDIYTRAVNQADISKCDEIMNSDTREECKNVITSLMVTADAETAIDASICDDIPLERYQADCVIKVEEMEAKMSENEEMKTFFDEQNELANKYIEEGNLEGCEELEDENFKEQCKSNILSQREGQPEAEE